MPASSFSCPYCDAPLRARDVRLAGRTVECPDCRRPLKVVADEMRQLSALALPTDDGRTAIHLPAAAVGMITSAAKSLPKRAARWQHLLGSPLFVAWLVAATVALMFVIAVWPEGHDRPNVVTGPVDASEPDKSQTIVLNPAYGGPSTNNTTQKSATVVAEPPVEAPRPTAVAAEPPIQIALAEPVVAEKPETGSAAIVDSPPDPAPPVDVAAALEQPILRFEQIRPAAFRDLLLLLNEMAGVPIVYDNIEPAVMTAAFDTRVSLTLDRTTVGEILDRVLSRVGLGFEIESGMIRLHPRTKDDQPADGGRLP